VREEPSLPPPLDTPGSQVIHTWSSPDKGTLRFGGLDPVWVVNNSTDPGGYRQGIAQHPAQRTASHVRPPDRAPAPAPAGVRTSDVRVRSPDRAVRGSDGIVRWPDVGWPRSPENRSFVTFTSTLRYLRR